MQMFLSNQKVTKMPEINAEMKKGKILVSTFVSLRRGEEGKAAFDWLQEKRMDYCVEKL